MISRQRAYQIRHRRLGLCIKCPNKAIKYGFCKKHWKDHRRLGREWDQKKFNRKRVYKLGKYIDV